MARQKMNDGTKLLISWITITQAGGVMTLEDCKALQEVIMAFIKAYNKNGTDEDLADLFDLLGHLEPDEKQGFWDHLTREAQNTKRWLANNRPKAIA
jgi:hypothetical protein